MKSFASDNISAAHPAVMQAMEQANHGSAKPYGQDEWTEKALAALQQTFGETARPSFVMLGTAANVLGLKSMLQSHQAILCSDSAHIHVDECGAPEAIIGCKIITTPSVNGKICLETCRARLSMREAVHHSYPKVLSITQQTESGTIYSIAELQEIGRFCRENGLYFHMDGARLANAAAALNVSLKAITADVGVDVLSFGGTKNGLLMGEAVIFFNPELGQEFHYLRKQHMQLTSKMRYIAAQFLAYLENDLWRTNAQAANNMATLLAQEIDTLDHVRFAFPVEGNALFVRMPKASLERLGKEYYFYIIDEEDAPGFPAGWPMARFLTAFDTTREEVMAFAKAIAHCK